MPNMSAPLSSVQDPWDRVNAWPENKPLRCSEAATFMRMSESTLSRLRTSGQGPDYYQAGMKVSGKDGPLGTNQHILYFKEDIEAHYKANKINSKTMAAVKKGQAFASVFDLVEEVAFYVSARGDIDGLVEEVPLGTFYERIGEWEIVWLPAIEGASRRWSDVARHKDFASQVSRVLGGATRRLEQSLEATDISSAAEDGEPRERTTIDGPRN